MVTQMINQWKKARCMRERDRREKKWKEKHRQRKGSIYARYFFFLFIIVSSSLKLMFLVIIIFPVVGRCSARIIIAFSFVLCYDGKQALQ